MSKWLALVLILVLAPLLGGAYGIVHDQITYTVSEEYYTKFKFIQFGLDAWPGSTNIGSAKAPEIQMVRPRLGAAVVGFMATWWVGLLIGVVLGLAGLWHRDGTTMFRVTLKAFVLTTVIALLVGVLGLLYGIQLGANPPPYWYLPNHVVHQTPYVMVGSMHNFSYLGGLVGLVVALIYTIRARRANA